MPELESIWTHIRMKPICHTPISHLLTRCLITAFFIGLASCGGGSNNPADALSPVAVDGQSEISDAGGIVSIQSTDSPIYGARVEIGTETLADDKETITISYEDDLPAPLNADALALGGTQISKVLVLKRTGTTDFGNAVRVTLPFDKSVLGNNVVPIVVFWDESISAYSPVTTRSLDRANGTVTFMTAHFSKFVMLVLDKLQSTTPSNPATLTRTVDFVPSVDGFFDHNFSSYDAPGGNCFGMAAYSAWYQASKKASKGAGLFSLYREGDPTIEKDDQTARELISRAFQLGNQNAHQQALNWINDLGFLTRTDGDRYTGYTILSQLVVTKQAQILAMGVGGFFNWTDGHAVTVYAYDGAKKTFRFYDNNYPGEIVELQWDPATGFGTYSKGTTWNVFAFASISQAYGSAALEGLFTGAENGWAASHFPKIAISAPVELASEKNTFEVASDNNVAIHGTVPRAPTAASPTAQRYVHVYIKGTKLGPAIPVSNADDSFTVPIAKLPTSSGTDVMLLVSENPKSWARGFNSFKQFNLRATGLISSISITPTSPRLGDAVIFDVNGANLQPGYTLSFPGCVPTEVSSASSTQRQFTCTMTQSGTNLQGTVSTSAGVVVYSFAQTVGASASTPDLLAQNVVFTPGTTAAGGNVTVNWNIVNQGTAGAAASTTTVRITSSATSSAGTNLASISTPALAAGASTNQQAVVAAPAIAGTYYVWVVADNLNTAGQVPSATGNDIVRAAPALTVSSVSGSPTISSVVTSPTMVTVGVQATFSVNGINLQPGYVFSLPGCNAIEIGSSSTTVRQFTCTPTQSGTNLAGSVSSANSTVLYSFVQTVNPSGPSGFQGHQIAAGGFHSCAITGSGGVKCWGYNAEGSLGDGTQQNRLTPVDVVGLGSGVTAITTFDDLTCALTSIGGAKCWGGGNIGDGTPRSVPHLTPTDVAGLSSGVIAISAGGSHACAVTATGGAKCWGSNLFGALGDGTWNDRLTPVDVVGLTSGVVAISAGNNHTCALTSAGGVKCWGTNVDGAIGDGTTVDRLAPMPVIGLASGVVAISAGVSYTCAVTSVGGVKCWGNSFWGSLGDGTAQQPRLVPVDAAGLGVGVGAIATSASGGDADHSCANMAAGSVKCWGNNAYGALGDGTTQNRLTPVDVVVLSNGSNGISAGFLHTCALTKVGGIKCWGANSRGALGDGTTQDRLTPVDVVGF